MLQRAKGQVEERIGAGNPIDAEQLAKLSLSAIRVAIAADEAVWACWCAHIYGQLGMVPPAAVVDALAEVAARKPKEILEPLADAIVRLRAVLPRTKEEDRIAFARLEQLHATTEARDAAAGGTSEASMRNPALS
jgi:hypothetical protein